ncbi:hypothetical protein XENOCAPTIV_027689, partial [Xenoophorus captivus]
KQLPSSSLPTTSRHISLLVALLSAPLLGRDHCINLAGCLSHDAIRVMLRWDPPLLRKCSRPFAHPGVPLWRVGHDTTESSYNPRAFLAYSNHCFWLRVPIDNEDLSQFQTGRGAEYQVVNYQSCLCQNRGV